MSGPLAVSPRGRDDIIVAAPHETLERGYVPEKEHNEFMAILERYRPMVLGKAS
jgi:hypothetical protein